MNKLYEDAEEFYKLVSTNVKKYRQEKGESQLEFSQNVGFNSVSFYCDCENNKNGKHFNLLHVVRIVDYLDIDVNKLIY
ncbi:helix-turn-helix transcriptional regulator [Halarcobacter bivalviorum]|uniref:Transcriptional regulator n=1 Tax=Halarcobacter bivalviorum TaxID=663364 RepID=A0AAX2A7H6_9BACT|nr:helix-turn-helix transcriptional regulator [Halarcobacter bivalviorum]AXH11413.1 transcriptional regulator, XRE family [Halarcobacter bivalviorum]RXK09400.1 transcriptional regulator [Halarcobacter bivalviorum]